jgi:outer membrane protein OmpA-like peptidoglycan-associated protein
MDRVYGTLALAYGITNFLEASAQIPVVLMQGGGLDSRFAAPPSFAVAPPTLALRLSVQESETFPLTLSAELGGTVGFGDPAAMVVDPVPRPNPRLRLNLGKNLGLINVFLEGHFIEGTDTTMRALRNVTTDITTDWAGGGAGVALKIPGFEDLSLEAAGSFDYDIKAPGTMTQLNIGAKYKLGDLRLYASFGPAFGDLIGTPAFRAMGGVMYDVRLSGQQKGPETKPLVETKPTGTKPTGPDPCMLPKADPDRCPGGDYDVDGVSNRADQCVTISEDLDSFQDGDGCPDPDNDGDGIADKEDKCPNEAGIVRLGGCAIPDKDHDGIADADDECPDEAGTVTNRGCVVKDRDNDGLVDQKDACPTSAGLPELRGCPAKDSDSDGVADHLDNCPKEKGVEGNGGCPPKKKQRVIITREGLELKDRIYFGATNAKIQARSKSLLKQVAIIVKSHPHIEKLVVEGHTDNQGDADKNLNLSQERADEVRKFIVKAGVDPTRVEAKGYGGDKPIDTNKTAAGRANNRRIDFVFAQPDDAGNM